jgi:hypothetical protein
MQRSLLFAGLVWGVLRRRGLCCEQIRGDCCLFAWHSRACCSKETRAAVLAWLWADVLEHQGLLVWSTSGCLSEAPRAAVLKHLEG